ncbi:MAG: asparagine synthase-related protein [Pseudomonadota bacterium]
MSGLCGWFSLVRDEGADPAEPRRQLARMAAPLTRFDGSDVQAIACGAAGVAIAAREDSAQLYREDGLLLAVWGQPTLADQADGVAHRLAALWPQHGAQACAELAGAFALCILDSRNGEVLLAVDRNGARPMLYQPAPQGLLFASSADALLAHPWADAALDHQAIYNYLYFHMVPSPGTMYRQQQRLLPGEYLHYRRGKLSRGQYWEMRYLEHEHTPWSRLKPQFLATVARAVQASLAGHEVGAFLSGGTDSSTLVAMLSQGGATARTYSIGFDVEGYDEMEYANIAVQAFNTRHRELYVTAEDVIAAIPHISAVFDQPFGNASAVPAYYCARMARADGITRMLGGDGGDELFGGNARYAHQAVLSRYERCPAPLRQLLLEPVLFGLLAGQQHRLLRKARSYVRQALLPLPARLETYNLLQGYGPGQVLEADFLAMVDSAAPAGALDQAYWRTRHLSQINRLLALDMHYTLADNDLPKVSKACELAGLEVAFPFLHDEVVAFAARLRPEDKLHGTRLRHFFRAALSDTLPPAILNKRKHGFGLPVGHWLHSHARLRSLAGDSLSDLKRRHIVRPAFIDALLDTHLASHPPYHGTMVWVLMMLEQWFQRRAGARRSHEEAHDGFEIRQG